MANLKLIACVFLGIVMSACVGPPGTVTEDLTPTDAEVEAYNASVAPEERIVCRAETPVGSHIPRRVCRLQTHMESNSTFTRAELRRIR